MALSLGMCHDFDLEIQITDTIRVAKDIVAERFQPDAETRFDMLGSFIRHGLTQDEAAGEALLQIIAGSDTSANTVRAFMLHVLTNPASYMKLQSEIDEGICTGGISSPVTDAEARSMPYLQAAIKEALRMMPPATGAVQASAARWRRY